MATIQRVYTFILRAKIVIYWFIMLANDKRAQQEVCFKTWCFYTSFVFNVIVSYFGFRVD